MIACVYDVIEPLDVAGLSDRSRRSWHPIEAEPLLAGAQKLGATPGEIETMLAKIGFFKEPASLAPSPSSFALRASEDEPGRGLPSGALAKEGPG